MVNPVYWRHGRLWILTSTRPTHNYSIRHNTHNRHKPNNILSVLSVGRNISKMAGECGGNGGSSRRTRKVGYRPAEHARKRSNGLGDSFGPSNEDRW